MAKQDYYETLGVSKTAGADEIKKAYRKMAMQYHPDRNPGDAQAEARFKEVNEAYDVLKDQNKRAAYDRFGHAAFDGSAGGRPGGGAGAAGFDFGAGFADIFDEMFGEFMGGARRGRGTSGRGADLRYNMEISLEEAYHGKQSTIRVPTSVVCDSCHGSGAEGGSEPVGCPTCNGMGKVRAQQGFFTIERTCPNCGGAGRVIKDPCKACGGAGRTEKERSLQVNIPAGVDDGTRIRLAGEGEAGLRGAPPGDLYIFLSIKAHPLFSRDGADLHCRVPIPMTTAALGGPIEVPTIDGHKAKVSIPPGTQSGAQFRLRMKGMSILRSTLRGDMYVEARVETPVNLTRRQKDLLEDFAKESGDESTHPEHHGFFAKVREFLNKD
ncbi:MAG: molecular chaperone DnaJ [Alphaproteobacteria bacterium]|jgi:molecular chaperone DnaJ|nr:molecular chaperone DnaJ [Alphaproteobacteria bacterium]